MRSVDEYDVNPDLFVMLQSKPIARRVVYDHLRNLFNNYLTQNGSRSVAIPSTTFPEKVRALLTKQRTVYSVNGVQVTLQQEAPLLWDGTRTGSINTILFPGYEFGELNLDEVVNSFKDMYGDYLQK